MRKDISRIKIKSVFFDPSVNLCIFEEMNTNEIVQTSLIYGQNGTGKTTISKAISNIKTQDNTEIEAELFDYSNNKIELSDNEIKEIYVYNDDFMENKVRFRHEDKLGVIVMLGEQVDIDNEILEKKEEVKKLHVELTKLKIEEYENEKSVKSPKYHLAKVKEQLSSMWGEREKLIQSNTRRSPVSEQLVQDAINDKSSYNIKLENENYKELLDQYYKVRDIKDDIVSIDFSYSKSIKINVESIRKILDLVIQKPIESDLSKKIRYAFDKYNVERIKEIEEFFLKKDAPFCPFCFREYNDIEADKILDEISKLINQEYNNLLLEIDRVKISDLYVNDLSNLSMLDPEIVSKYNKISNDLKTEIEKINDILESKKNNPYTSLSIETKVDYLYKIVLEVIADIENEISILNESIKGKKLILQKLQSQNKRLAIAECQTQIKTYSLSVKEQKTAKDEFDKLNSSLQILNNKIEILESKKENTELAIEKINRWLSLIFLDSKRINLVYEKRKYAVKSRGKSIRMKDLSNGERNAVGLSYFFASINEKKSGNTYSDVSKLIVLDDPLSSFDFENKLGIYSFLKSIFSDVIDNDDSKILILTHQLDTMFSMNQMMSDDKKLCKRKRQQILIDKSLKPFKGNANIYHRLLLEIGDFLLPGFNGDLSSIPNKVRRVLESFSTFNFGCGMTELSTKESIIENIKDIKIREYLKDSMYRITLNNESHLQDQAKGIEEGMLMYFEDKDTLTKMVKDILLIIKELNESHFLEIYKGKKGIIDEIKNHRQYLIDTL
ncbi:MAG: AAA family ATPase [Candidatus Izemoplasmatales bacterium]|nr:AAA family ATPase [Candidatus Izemoplasmatales bacterium]